MTFQSIFRNEGKHLRSGWRFLLFFFFFFLAYEALIAALAAVGPGLGLAVQADNAFFLGISRFIGLLLADSLSWLCQRYLEGLGFDVLGFSPSGTWIRNLSMGMALGGAGFALACLLGLALGGMRFSFNGESPASSMVFSMLTSFAVLAVAATFEELLLRGYLLQTFVRSDLPWVGVALTSAIFGLLHGANPNVGNIALLNTILAGIWFSVAYLKTRTLWLPIGLHISWNWIQGNVFGIEISGLKNLITDPLMRETDLGPEWLTGGSYGIEGGILCTIALGASIGLVGLVRVDGRR